ncbi:hypothetical protein SCUCBS95973_001722 [Sporothrix curviconia]|uniref:Myb-like domain-containing protein n=1 Tax=Sporothrix curviconia TaxID=1260050 RepID=A0ABP0B0X9_9PEZI
MSSMFKKKGGLAFKPKAPAVRRAGAAAAATSPTTTNAASTAAAAAAAGGTAAPAERGTAAIAAGFGSLRDSSNACLGVTGNSGNTANSLSHGRDRIITGHARPRSSARKPNRRAANTPRYTDTEDANNPKDHQRNATRKDNIGRGAPARKTRGAAAAQSQPRPAAVPRDELDLVIDPAIIASEATDAARSLPAEPATAPRRGRPRAADRAAVAAVEASTASETQDGAASTTTPSTEDGAAAAAAAAPKKRKYTRRKPLGEAAEGAEGTTAPKPRKGATRKRSAAAVSADGVVLSVETVAGDAAAAPAAVTPAGPAAAAPKRVRRERSVTPEDAETRTVDHRELKMEDLTKDLRIGKKFSRHDELVDRLREKRRLYRRERLLNKKNQSQSPGLNGALSTNNSSRDGSVLGDESGLEPSAAGASRSGSGSGRTAADVIANARGSDAVTAAASVLAAATAKMKPTQQAVTGPQFEIIDGAIVVNQASLVHDRHAAAAAEAGELEEVEENDFTRQTTSNTYLKPGKLRGPNAWTEAETELFYRALSMFGTSFDLICKWFPGKSRRHIKMKFNREDKLRPQRITEALVGQNKVAIDVDEYMARTGMTLHATEAIDAEYALRQAEHDAEQQRIVDEQQEALRKKREALFGPRNGGGDVGGKDRSAGGVGGGSGSDGANGGGGDDDEIDETDMMPGGKGRNGRAGRGGRGGRYGGRSGGPRQAVAGGFGI